ncbi:ABC transporter ATP-binding protein [Alkalicoccus daliensis]|uniref:Carnitine transport ATP-binding protein OpuCA n=1 Tax=Alkalicoccus daliensis TaxID=745820 RepID=A0A1H0K8W3_9BACI|nr:ABC transporter ATP-binding protein [Alkalicoccus daliensis]SDO52161.1 iron(III) transport system ATP-binding protein [Alkalicoccus daliensis]
MLKLRQAAKKYEDQVIFSNIDIAVKAGDIVSILGPSGCGKTSLLRCIAGLAAFTEGELFIDSREVTRIKAENRPVVLMFQEPLLFPHLTVLQNAIYGMKHGKRKLSRKERIRQAEEMLKKIEMFEWKDRYPSQLSGGQQQRVSLARALLLQPSLLLLDEPFSSLDAHLRHSLRIWVRDFLKQEGVTALFVTHDREEAAVMSDRLIVMKDGKLQQEGEPREVYEQPLNKDVADFMSDGLHLDGEFYTASSLSISGSQAGTYQGIIEHPLFAYGYTFYRIKIPELEQSVVVRSDEVREEGQQVSIAVQQKGSAADD